MTRASLASIIPVRGKRARRRHWVIKSWAVVDKRRDGIEAAMIIVILGDMLIGVYEGGVSVSAALTAGAMLASWPCAVSLPDV